MTKKTASTKETPEFCCEAAKLRAEDKISAARKALQGIAANKCDCSGCIMVRAIVAFLEEP